MIKPVSRPYAVVVLLMTLLGSARVGAFQLKPGLASGGRESAAESLDSLRARIETHISQARFAPASWGIKVVSLSTGKVVFERNAAKYFNPASNAKLYTAALALDRLGADYRIKTSLYSRGRPDHTGRLRGDLIVYGRGDPTIGGGPSGDCYQALEPLVSALLAAGVRRVEGDLVGDESYFTGPPLGSGWEWDDLQWYYGAEVSALSFNDNALNLTVQPGSRMGIAGRVATIPATPLVTIINRTRTGAAAAKRAIGVYRPVGENIIYVSGQIPADDPGFSGYISIHKPARLFASFFREALTRHGIKVSGTTRTADWLYRQVTPLDLSKMTELGSVSSPPLAEIVRQTLKPSQNLYAQLLLLHVGASRLHGLLGHGARVDRVIETAEGDAEQTTEEAGIDELRSFLAEVGLVGAGVLLEEGAGLSRRDEITPDSVVALLTFMSRHKAGDAYRSALPVAGVDGTLQNRMKATSAAANLRAKTGSLRYVNALSGYVTTAAGERFAFSIILNNYFNGDRSQSSREDIDAIAIMLASFTGHS